MTHRKVLEFVSEASTPSPAVFRDIMNEPLLDGKDATSLGRLCNLQFRQTIAILFRQKTTAKSPVVFLTLDASGLSQSCLFFLSAASATRRITNFPVRDVATAILVSDSKTCYLCAAYLCVAEFAPVSHTSSFPLRILQSIVGGVSSISWTIEYIKFLSVEH